MQHVQFITAFVIRNHYRAIKSKIAITVCVRLEKSIFLYATVSQIVPVTDIIYLSSQVNWLPQTDREQTDCEAVISLHDFVTDFVAVILSQSQGLGKMALGIVKIYLGSPFSANRRCLLSVCSRSVGSRSVVVDPTFVICRIAYY